MRLANSADYQVDDDPALFGLMLDDMRGADRLYQPTNYWAAYWDLVTQEIQANGLRDFRRREAEVLSRFGAIDMPPAFAVPDRGGMDQANWELFKAVVGGMTVLWNQGAHVGPGMISAAEFYRMCEMIADTRAAEAGITPASRLSFSRYGNPIGFEQDGRNASFAALYYYNFACFAAGAGALDKVDVVVEIGSGYGGQAEVLKTLFPHLTIVVMDLAPQLCVAERFLTKSFPDAVMPYRETRDGTWDGKLVAGKVHFLAPSAIETLAPEGRVLFWNAASFGEMEPEVVTNYARHVSRFADALFLMQFFHGKPLGRVGEGGVLAPSTMATYEAAFPDFERIALADALNVDGVSILREGERSLAYQNSVWTRRG
jgi:putative sugar O-methyltransferase